LVFPWHQTELHLRWSGLSVLGIEVYAFAQPFCPSSSFSEKHCHSQRMGSEKSDIYPLPLAMPWKSIAEMSTVPSLVRLKHKPDPHRH